MQSLSQPTAVDLFCGAGGLSLGLSRAGFRVVAAADHWAPAVASYRMNHPEHRMLDVDLGGVAWDDFMRQAGIVPGSVDLVAGGPPCQGFSIQRIGEDTDSRNHLVLKFGELVARIRPAMFLMENVPGLLGKRGRELAACFAEGMGRAGYHVRSAIVDAATFGVPQHRRRVVFIGCRRDVLPPLAVPVGDLDEHEFKTVRETFEGLPSPPADYTPHPDDPLHRWMKVSALNERRLRHIPPGGGFESLPVDLRVDCHKQGAARIGHRYVYGRLHPDEPAGTITARFDSFTRGKFAHPEEHRNITLREGARLQTFPDAYRFVGTQEEVAAQIGNAVPPLLAERLARVLRAHLTATLSRPASISQPDGPQMPLFADVDLDGAAVDG